MLKMFSKQFEGNRYSQNYVRYVADTVEDVKKIPVKISSVDMGCEVYVIQTGKTYVLGSGKIWYSASGEKIECDCTPESTIWESIKVPTEEDT